MVVGGRKEDLYRLDGVRLGRATSAMAIDVPHRSIASTSVAWCREEGHISPEAQTERKQNI